MTGPQRRRRTPRLRLWQVLAVAPRATRRTSSEGQDGRSETGDRGSTLIELIMAVALSAMLLAAASFSLITGLKTNAKADERLDESHDGQLLAHWLPIDVQSAAAAPPSTDPATGHGCANPVTGTNVVHLTLSASSAAGDPAGLASYRLEQSPEGVTQLVRYRCLAGAAADRVVVSHDITAAVAAASVAASGEPFVTVTVTVPSGNAYTVQAAGRTPTASAAPPTPPTVTTTSTSTTTTTAPASCAATGLVAVPNPVNRTSTSGNAARRLVSNVLVTVTTTGPCSALSISYNVGSGPDTSLGLAGAGGVWTATIPGNGTPGAQNWRPGSHPITVVGATTQPSPTPTLVVG